MRMLKKLIANRIAYRKACNQLYAMSDRELNDIGVGRGYIAAAARASAE